MKKIIFLSVILLNICIAKAVDNENYITYISVNNGSTWQTFTNVEEFTKTILLETLGNNKVILKSTNNEINQKYKDFNDFLKNLIIVSRELKYVIPTKGINNSDNIIPLSRIKIYPLPAGKNINIDLGSRRNMKYKLFDLNGRCLKESTNYLYTDNFDINVSNYINGYYQLILFFDDNTVISKNIIVNRE